MNRNGRVRMQGWRDFEPLMNADYGGGGCSLADVLWVL